MDIEHGHPASAHVHHDAEVIGCRAQDRIAAENGAGPNHVLVTALLVKLHSERLGQRRRDRVLAGRTVFGRAIGRLGTRLLQADQVGVGRAQHRQGFVDRFACVEAAAPGVESQQSEPGLGREAGCRERQDAEHE